MRRMSVRRKRKRRCANNFSVAPVGGKGEREKRERPKKKAQRRRRYDDDDDELSGNEREAWNGCH
ncbi:MAG: hypothetical protein ACTSUE_04120 [Promethearchaeota archaeon]